jgi:hypothetical protein
MVVGISFQGMQTGDRTTISFHQPGGVVTADGQAGVDSAGDTRYSSCSR